MFKVGDIICYYNTSRRWQVTRVGGTIDFYGDYVGQNLDLELTDSGTGVLLNSGYKLTGTPCLFSEWSLAKIAEAKGHPLTKIFK